MLRRPSRAPRLLYTLPALVCAFAIGCGGPSTNRVSGTAKFNGQSIPTGKIYFVPDASKGNSGPSGYADIKDGSFDTSSGNGQGAVAGAIIVRIEGFAPLPEAKGDVTAKPLFYPYEIKVDLPNKASTHTFEVPASAAKEPQQPGGAGGPAVVP